MDMKTVLQNKRRSVQELGEMAASFVPEPHKARMEEFVQVLVEVEREDADSRVNTQHVWRQGARDACLAILELLGVEGYEPRIESVVSAMDKLVYDAVPDDDRFIEMQRKLEGLCEERDKYRADSIDKSRDIMRLERILSGRSEEALALGKRCKELLAEAEPNLRLQEQVHALSDANVNLRVTLNDTQALLERRTAEANALRARNGELEVELEVESGRIRPSPIPVVVGGDLKLELERAKEHITALQNQITENVESLEATILHPSIEREVKKGNEADMRIVELVEDICMNPDQAIELIQELIDDHMTVVKRCLKSLVMDISDETGYKIDILEAQGNIARRERDEAREKLAEAMEELAEAREWAQAGAETKTILRRERDAAQQQILELQRALKEERDNSLRLAGEVDRLVSGEDEGVRSR